MTSADLRGVPLWPWRLHALLRAGSDGRGCVLCVGEMEVGGQGIGSCLGYAGKAEKLTGAGRKHTSQDTSLPFTRILTLLWQP